MPNSPSLRILLCGPPPPFGEWEINISTHNVSESTYLSLLCLLSVIHILYKAVAGRPNSTKSLISNQVTESLGASSIKFLRRVGASLAAKRGIATKKILCLAEDSMTLVTRKLTQSYVHGVPNVFEADIVKSVLGCVNSSDEEPSGPTRIVYFHALHARSIASVSGVEAHDTMQ